MSLRVSAFRITLGLSLGLFAAWTTGTAPAHAGDFATLVDLDLSPATGCDVGAFQGADFELVTTVNTLVEPPSVTALALNQCIGGAFVPFAGPNPFTPFTTPWPAGSEGGLDAIETYLPLTVAPNAGAASIRLGFYSGSRVAPVDVLFTTNGQTGGAPIVLQGTILETPTLDTWGFLVLVLILAFLATRVLRSRRLARAQARGLAALLLLSALGVAMAASPHQADGLLLDWSGHAAVANDVFPPADAPIDFEIRRAFATREGGVLFLRIDIDASSIPPPTDRFAGPTSSQPLALSASGEVLAVANPDDDSASVFDLRGDSNLLLARVTVQDEPTGVAVLPDGSRAYVANTVSGTVSVIPIDLVGGIVAPPSAHIPVGGEPGGLALAPNGTRLYVANARSNSVSVIDTSTDTVIATIPAVGREPRGLALTNDGDADDSDEKLYVTSFLAFPVLGRIPGADDSGEGHVTVISTATHTVVGTAIVGALADTGFDANGDALARTPPGASFTFPTGAYPNQLANVAIQGGFAYLPSTGASPNGPLRFDVNTQALLSAIDTASDTDAGVTINLHQAVAAQTASPRLFPTQPQAIAFRHASPVGYVVSAASNVVLKVAVDPTTGAPSVAVDPTDPTRVLQIAVGKNPRGIVINWNDTRAYVLNHISRDVSVLDLTAVREQVIATLTSAPLPTPGTLEDLVHVGEELYNTSIGVFDPATTGGAPITGRLSANGWSSCASCHPSGLSDQVVWIFPSGPRRTIAQHVDFDPQPPQTTTRILGWSAIRDEQEDFELKIRSLAGGLGLLVQADGVTPEPTVNDLLAPANGGRNQLKVRGLGAWDALAAYVDRGIRVPLPAQSATDPDAVAGRALFISAACQSCHGGEHWTSGLRLYTPPAAPGQIAAGQISSALRNVGTFDPTATNEVRDDASAPLGASGFAPPSLLSAFAFEGLQLHGGGERTFDDVLLNVTHRSAGTGGVDTLSNAADRARIAIFLRSIGATTPPVP